MYDELVKSLRICGDSVDAIDECCYEECIQHKRPIDPLCMQALCNKAADAVEELSMKLHGDEAAIAGMKREIERMVVAGKPRWIPVTERLPDGIVIAINALRGTYGYHEQLIGYIGKNEESDSGYLCESEGEILMNVTHWQPLPEPPKEETWNSHH